MRKMLSFLLCLFVINFKLHAQEISSADIDPNLSEQLTINKSSKTVATSVNHNTIDVTTNYMVDGEASVIITNTSSEDLEYYYSVEYLDKNDISKSAWERVYYFTASVDGEQGIVTYGNYIYTTFWNAAGKFGKYEMDGTFIETFTIEETECNPPTNLTVSMGNYDIKLSWTTPGGKCNSKEVILSEDFEGLPSGGMYGLPDGWLNIDADGDTYAWLGFKDAGTPSIIPGHSGTGFMSSASFLYGGLLPDNWLITNKLTIGNNGEVTYWVNAQDNEYAEEHYGIYISTTGTEINNFTLLFEETLTAKSSGNKGVRGTNEQGTWYERTIDLSDYSGNIYLAWRHFNCYDQFRMNLDDITVTSDAVITPPPGLVGYNIYFDGNATPIATVGPTITNYTHDVSSLENGTYRYCIVSVCEEGFESDDECIDVTINNVGIDSYSNIKLYPNPTNTIVNIEGENITKINVYNSAGQNVAKYENTNVINVSSYSNGVYFINITTIDGTVERHKVVVVH